MPDPAPNSASTRSIGAHQTRPGTGRLWHQRVNVGDVASIAAGTFTLFLDPVSAGLVPDDANFAVAGVGVRPLPQPVCDPPLETLWLVGVLLGSPVNRLRLLTVAGDPLDEFVNDEGFLAVPIAPDGRTLRARFELITEVGALRGDFLFELVWAEL